MPKIIIYLLLFSLIFLEMGGCVFAENNVFNSSTPITQINHTFWIKFSPAESKILYNIQPEEVIKGYQDEYKPNIRVVGSLVLQSAKSVESCYVRLPSMLIQATNQKNQSINIRLRGLIGTQDSTQNLTNEYIHPKFNEFNEARFVIEGFIEPTQSLRRFAPGEYDFLEQLNLSVEFRDN